MQRQLGRTSHAEAKGSDYFQTLRKSGINDVADLQSKVANNNTGHCQTRFYGNLDSFIFLNYVAPTQHDRSATESADSVKSYTVQQASERPTGSVQIGS